MLLNELHVLITGDNSDAKRALRETQVESERASSGIGTAAKGAAIGIAGLAAAGGAFAGVTAAVGLQQAGAAEQAQIAFETMLGSGEKAEAFLTGLKEFAATTPFEFPELRTAASSLVSAGIEADKVIPIMTTLGDVTSGMGTGAEGVKRATVALQQMNAAGKITAEDLNQLRDAGIPVYDLLAAATGKSKEAVTALASQGKLGRQELEQLMGALESGAGLERFNGLMEKQSQSLFGLLSTLKDTVLQDLGDAAAPLVDLAKEQLPAITEALGSVTDGLGPMFRALGQSVVALVPLVQPLADLLSDLALIMARVLTDAVEAFGPVLAALVPVIGQVMEQLADGLGQVLPEIGEAFLAIVNAVGPLIPQLLDLAMSAILPLVSQLARLVPMLTPVITQLGEGLVAALSEAMPSIGELTSALGDVLVAIVPILPSLAELLLAFTPLIPPLASLTASLAEIAAIVLENFAPSLVKGIEQVTAMVEPVVELTTALADLLDQWTRTEGARGFLADVGAIAIGPVPGLGGRGENVASERSVGRGAGGLGPVQININEASNPEAVRKVVAEELQAVSQSGTRTLRQTRGRG